LALFLHQCKRTGLDPLARQIYCIKRGGKATIQTGIDGYRLIADRTGVYAGNDDPRFEGDEDGHPLKATVTVWKLVGGQRCGFTATARWSEYKAEGPMWGRMPYLMLGKVAEALALRKAFPADLSGLYTDEEMDQAAPSTAPALVAGGGAGRRKIDRNRLEHLYEDTRAEAEQYGIEAQPVQAAWSDDELIAMGKNIRASIQQMQEAGK
jgi:phage recombination protein Bet